MWWNRLYFSAKPKGVWRLLGEALINKHEILTFILFETKLLQILMYKHTFLFQW